MIERALPPPLQELRDVLAASGYQVVDEDYRPSNFGNMVVVFTKRALSVRFVRERDQWFVEISVSPNEDWFSPLVWRAYLDGEVGDLSTPSLEEQCDLVTRELPRIEAAAEVGGELVEHLRSYRAQRSEARRLQA